MKILLVEDEFLVSDFLNDILMNLGFKTNVIANSYEEAINSLSENEIDFAFVDINLGEELTGIDVAFVLNEKKIPFVYLTANTEIETIKKAIHTNSLAFVTKPFNEIDIIAQLELFKSKSKKETYTIIEKGNKFEINQEDIFYIGAEGSYCYIFCENEAYLQRKNLKSILEELNKEIFNRTHRSFIVNLDKIKSKNAKELTLQNGVILPYSKI